MERGAEVLAEPPGKQRPGEPALRETQSVERAGRQWPGEPGLRGTEVETRNGESVMGSGWI